MAEPDESIGSFVPVASYPTPTEAHLMRNVLQSAGLSARLADANFVQAEQWLTAAVGGVRLLVPASQVAAAKTTIEEYNAGSFKLEGDEAPAAPTYAEQPAMVFSPDQAALFSLLLTPVFGAAIQVINDTNLRLPSGRVTRWVWLLVLVAISTTVIIGTHQADPSPTVVFEASMFLWFVTAVWYFAAGKSQTRALIATYGPHFKRKRLLMPGVVCAVACLAAGWVLSEWA